MGPAAPVVLRMSAWASPWREVVIRAVFAFVALGACLMVAVPLFLLFGDGGMGLSWGSVALTAGMAVAAAGFLLIARLLHGQAGELRASRHPGEVAVFPDRCRIHFPGVLARDLVLTADQIRAVCVDDRGPAWAALTWCRFPIASTAPRSRAAGCLFRPGLRNALQLVAPGPGMPNVAVVFTRPLRIEGATGLGQIGESLAVVGTQFDDIETTADLPGARPIDPLRDHRGIFLKVDSAAAARQAFATWPAARDVLRDADVPAIAATPMPDTARKVAGGIGFIALVGSGLLAVFALLTGSWALLVWILAAAAAATLAYQTLRSLRALTGPRRAGAGSRAVTLVMMLATLVVGLFELPQILELDDPPPREQERIPTIPTITPFPTLSPGLPDDPFPSAPTFDPLRP